jgi:hypothetical protein
LDVSRWENPQSDDLILKDRRRHLCVLDVKSFRAADGDADPYLVVAKIRERIAAYKQGLH